jgi:hypothetical protein
MPLVETDDIVRNTPVKQAQLRMAAVFGADADASNWNLS